MCRSSSLIDVSWPDRAIGIVLGLIIGIVALILFVFGVSGDSIDAPSLHHSDAQSPAATTKK